MFTDPSFSDSTCAPDSPNAPEDPLAALSQAYPFNPSVPLSATNPSVPLSTTPPPAPLNYPSCPCSLGELPSQTDIDAAYSVKIFLDHHPGRHRTIAMLSLQSGLPEERLKRAFEFLFNEGLDHYWEKVQWKELSNGARHVAAV